jgi:hypothetical protein
MPVFNRTIAAVCVLAALALAAAAHSPAAAQQAATKRAAPTGAGRATIHFLRPEGLIAPYAPDVELDGRNVGELRAGTYFVVQTASGRHALKIPGVFIAGSCEGEVTLPAGTTHFIELGTCQTGAIGMRGLTALLAGTKGEPMSGGGFNASYCFFRLEPEPGRAAVAKLKRVGGK